jgi:hypothetical protein
MNLLQRIVLGLVAVVITIMALFPPWAFVYKYSDLRIERFAGYHPIWLSNAPTDSAALSRLLSFDVPYADLALVTMKIDTARLAIQIITTLIVSLLIYSLLKAKPKSHYVKEG